MGSPSTLVAFPGLVAGDTVVDACQGLTDDLVARGLDLPSVYLFAGERLRCYAARGYFQVVDGFRPGRGVIGTVVATGVSEYVADVSTRPDFIAAIPGLTAEVCVAVRVFGRIAGAVSVESRSVLPDGVLELVEAAATALGRRLEALGGLPAPSLAQRLAQVSIDMTAASTTADLEARAVRAATELSDFSTAAIVHLTPSGPVLTEACGPQARHLRSWGDAELADMAGWVSWGTSSHFPGGDETPDAYGFLTAAGVRAVSVHPMVVGGETTGLLVLTSAEPVSHAPAVVDCLELLAAQTAALLGLVTALREVSRRADRDDLTGLANRSQYAVAVERAHAARSDAPLSVLLLDLDDFKNVNDSLGHHAGDRLLCEVAGRLRATLRPEDTPCRLGGDEFALVLPGTTAAQAEEVAQKLLRALGEPVRVDDAVLEVTASIGVATSSARAEGAEQLLRAADLAMYLAKKRGKGRTALFQPSMQLAALDRLALESDLRRAVREKQLGLAYQPVVDLATGVMVSVEALVRWVDPQRGPVSPNDFIPVAEESGLVVPLGEWVLQEACAQLLRWDADGGDRSLRMSVNVSTRQLERPGLLAAVDACLTAGLAPHRLVLEITETALTVDGSAALETLVALRDRGIEIAVDDFGTGYSSLDRLRSAPIGRLKIDRSFVAEIGPDGGHVPIVDATLSMGHGLGLTVVAEGVETPAQLAHLRAARCPEAQGYLLSRPVAADEVPYRLDARPPWADLF